MVMRHAMDEDVEKLLTREARARLPLRRLLRLYLDPGALFKDASRGSTRARELALVYNRRMRWMLVPYMRRWTLISASSFFGIAPAEAASPIPAAALAVGCSISLIVVGCTVLAYLVLRESD
jgi:hypothetical protein